MIQPSDAERAGLPEATSQYLDDLETALEAAGIQTETYQRALVLMVTRLTETVDEAKKVLALVGCEPPIDKEELAKKCIASKRVAVGQGETTGVSCYRCGASIDFDENHVFTDMTAAGALCASCASGGKGEKTDPWLPKQIAETKGSIESRPEWMKRVQGFEKTPKGGEG